MQCCSRALAGAALQGKALDNGIFGMLPLPASPGLAPPVGKRPRSAANLSGVFSFPIAGQAASDQLPQLPK